MGGMDCSARTQCHQPAILQSIEPPYCILIKMEPNTGTTLALVSRQSRILTGHWS